MEPWIASSRSPSSGAHSRDPLAPRNDGATFLSTSSKVTTARVFAIAGPAMIANLTTPLIGIVHLHDLLRAGVA